MKFNEFKERIESEYHKRFNDSYCICKVGKCLGTYISIGGYLAKDKSELPHGITHNDTIHMGFMIHLPDGLTTEDELPEEMEITTINHSIIVKPSNPYMYCDIRKIPFRKTKGNAEKMIKTFAKFTDKLHDALCEEYKSDNLLEVGMNLMENKHYVV